jgi:hypothetical protein
MKLFTRRPTSNINKPPKILAIHMKDETTDFLKPIYDDNVDLVVTNPITSNTLNKLMHEHDTIYMLGHGSAYGLRGDYNYRYSYIVNHNNIRMLKNKYCLDARKKRQNIEKPIKAVFMEPQKAPILLITVHTG